MKYMTSDEIRDTWLRFFKSKGHYVEPSASLVPVNDPTLLWINSGVAALKKYFDGSERPAHRRITNAQKSIRTNDIENVGHTARHHTFFEMMGNFSIGDYFRNEVIPWAYELLFSKENFGLDKDKLYVTYHPSDTATRDLWIKCGLAPDHLIPLEGNFWEIGEGPCGPDTEMFYDRGEKYDPEGLGIKLLKDDIENDRYIEIWNIVFSQYNAVPGKKREEYKELPQKNIDTGAGLERICCIIQGTETNYETDLFMPYIKEIEKNANKPYEGENKLAYRVIADHIRSVTFALADGAVFSNDGRGYVLRRLLRRAERYANSLGIKSGFLSKLVSVVCNNMSHFYPYLLEKEEKIAKTVLSEEEKFAKTLKSGEAMLNDYLAKCEEVLPGVDAFKLFDTYGFPLELTVEIASEKGKKVDIDGYNTEMNAQKERARNARGTQFSMGLQSADLLAFTEKSEFTYEEKPLVGTVIGLFKDGVKVNELTEDGEVIFDKTDFYAESGGQISDIGIIENTDAEAEVLYVSKAPNKQYLHKIKVVFGSIKLGDKFDLKPDLKRRKATKKNHSCTHILQKTLQMLVNPEIHQEGSYVSDTVLRFDFNSDRKLTEEEIEAVEQKVNEVIFEAIPQETKIMAKDEAKKTGAMSLFNEKYDDFVRVVSFGDYSKEFCAGTHVANTSEIMAFAIVSEEAISSGIRRITAVTGLNAIKFLAEKRAKLNDVSKSLGVKSDKEIPAKLKSLSLEKDELKNRITALEGKVLSSYLQQVKNSYEIINGKNLYVAKLENFTHNQVTDLAKDIVLGDQNAIVLVANDNGAKKEIGIALGSEVQKSYKAGMLIKEIAVILGGSGGGKPDMAFGGTTSLENLPQAIERIKELAK